MLLVFGGTTEGKRCATALSGAGEAFIYSTKTPVVMNPLPGMSPRTGPLTPEALMEFCRSESIRGIVHASHPFAEQLHSTISSTAEVLDLPVWRFERCYPARENAGAHIRYVPDFVAAIEALQAMNRAPLLALTGVQTIEKLRPWWQTHPTFFQILDRPASWALAESLDFPRERLLARDPWYEPDALAAEIFILGIRMMVTKESGASGFQLVKMEAARRADVPLLVIQRPVLPACFQPVHDEAELLKRIAAARLL